MYKAELPKEREKELEGKREKERKEGRRKRRTEDRTKRGRAKDLLSVILLPKLLQ